VFLCVSGFEILEGLRESVGRSDVPELALDEERDQGDERSGLGDQEVISILVGLKIKLQSNDC